MERERENLYVQYKMTWALFSFKIVNKMATVALSFVFYKYYLIMD